MKILSRFFVFLTGVLSLAVPVAAQEPPASFVTTLGEDTLVIERFHIGADSVNAEVLMRSPRTEFRKQVVFFNPDGSFREFRSAAFDPKNPSGHPLEEQISSVVGDSITATIHNDSLKSRKAFLYDPSLLPWIDMVHWPYEVATRIMIKNNESAREQKMLTDRNLAVFTIKRLAPDSVSIKHPFRGTMYAKINEEGQILVFDATATTRKLMVKRGGSIDMQALATKYADRGIGALSGEGQTAASIQGARILVTYGQPARRGRTLFGGIVPWDTVWRTGANRATHFRTDKDLQFGTLAMPAGTYTLFSIPAPDGGMLIINTQTGQNGNSYDTSRDLGRVPMKMKMNDENVELFSIDVLEKDGKGTLQLKWSQTIFEIPFEVVP